MKPPRDIGPAHPHGANADDMDGSFPLTQTDNDAPDPHTHGGSRHCDPDERNAQNVSNVGGPGH
jgi:hypothetical protein